MKRKLLVILGTVLALFVFYVIYQIATFSLFEVEATLIKQIDIPSKKYSLRIYSVPANATTYSAIQVRKYSDTGEEVLQGYENWNHLKSASISNDTLTLVISDTMHSIRGEEVRKIKLP